MKSIVGVIIGRVTFQNFRSGPAPSISATSYSDFGTSAKPARKITTAPPTLQKLMRISEGMDQFSSESQLGKL